MNSPGIRIGSADDHFDAGEWTREVDGAEGRVTVKLSLPLLLEQLRGEKAPHDPLEDSGTIAALRFQTERALRKATRATRSAKTPAEAARILTKAMKAEAGPSSSTARADQPAEEARTGPRVRAQASCRSRRGRRSPDSESSQRREQRRDAAENTVQGGKFGARSGSRMLGGYRAA